MQWCGLPHPGEYLRLCPLLCNRLTKTKKKYGSNERIQLSDKEIANLSDTEFKTLVIRMLIELVEYGCKLEEKVKAMRLYPKTTLPSRWICKTAGYKVDTQKSKAQRNCRNKNQEKNPLWYSNKKNKVPRNQPNQGGKRPVLRKLYNTEQRN